MFCLAAQAPLCSLPAQGIFLIRPTLSIAPHTAPQQRVLWKKDYHYDPPRKS
jgi:hypothetical protein